MRITASDAHKVPQCASPPNLQMRNPMPRAKPRGDTSMATGAETLKTTVEQFTTAGNKAFKDGVEKSMAAFGEANTHSKKNLEAVVASMTAATKGAEALGAQAMAFSKKTVEDQVSAAKTLASAKSVQEVVELQTSFAKSALEAYMAQMN